MIFKERKKRKITFISWMSGTIFPFLVLMIDKNKKNKEKNKKGKGAGG